jgi:hypothetical protein
VCQPGPVAPDGTSCFDNDACTAGDHCQGGQCVGNPIVCPGASDQCHEPKTCDPVHGCMNAPLANGTPCDDGDRCTSEDTCKLGVCGGTPIPACHIDEFKCYQGTGPKRVAQPVTLDGRLGTTDTVLGRADTACNPASDGGPFEDQNTHLTCSRLKLARGASLAPHTLTVHDRFADATLTVLRPQALCVPSTEPTLPGSANHDELACFRVRGGGRADRLLTLTDEFETASTKVLRPRTLCVPVRRDQGPTVTDAKSSLLCYTVHAATGGRFAARSITLDSALGTDTLEVTQRRTLCVPTTIDPCAAVSFTSTAGSTSCGGPKLAPPPGPPFSGAVFDAVTGGNKVADLGDGCTYFGGGDSEYYPAAQTNAGTGFALEANRCDADVLSLISSAGSSFDNCTLGPSSRKICLNDVTRTCTSDTDCQNGQAGSCQFAPRCFGGPPTPFRSQFNVCFLSGVTADATGTLNPTTGELAVQTRSNTYIYLTYTDPPCPLCVNDVCQGGSRDGRSCTPGGALEPTSLDCPPFDYSFYLTLGGTSSSSSATTPVTRTSATGLFCPGQVNPGAFGSDQVRRIEETGIPTGSLLDFQPHPATLLDVACIGSTGNPVVDQAADFPGPQATSTAGTLQMRQ